jgi:hypothetical protein
MTPPPVPRFRIVRSGGRWFVLDGLTVVGTPTSCLLVAECRATALNRAEDLTCAE